jgi:excisionase family DNA binding protein
MDETTLLRPPEVARRLQVSRARAYQLLASREIPVVRVGRLVRVDPGDLDAYIRNQRDTAG